MDRTDHEKLDWVLLVATKLRVDGADTGGEAASSVAERYYTRYPTLSPAAAISLYLTERSRLHGRRRIVSKQLWIDRFVDHFEQLAVEPQQASRAVVDFAESTYHMAWDLVPEEVVESYATAHCG